jgi:hypothetical protein
MDRPPHPDEDDNETRRIYRVGFGDIGIVAIAAFCTLAFILMMVLPSPVAKYERMRAQADQAERQKALSAPIPGGEVSVGITPAKPR